MPVQNRKKSGFTLVEIVVAMALMSVVMTMVLTAVLMINNFTGRETNFTELLDQLTAARTAVNRLVSAADRCDCKLSATKEDMLCVFTDDGDLALLDSADFPEAVEVSYFPMDVESSVRCELVFGEAAINFDVLDWVRSGVNFAAAQQFLDLSLAAAFPEGSPVFAPDSDSGGVSVRATNDDSVLLRLFWNAEKGGITAEFAGENLPGDDDDTYAQLVGLEEDTNRLLHAEGSPSWTLCFDGVTGAVFEQDAGGNFNCRVEYKGAQGIAYSKSLLLSLPTELVRTRSAVLLWVYQEMVGDGGLRRPRVGIASGALISEAEDGSRDCLCYVTAGHAAEYFYGLLLRREDSENLLLRTGEPPYAVKGITDMQFQLGDDGVICSVYHSFNADARCFPVFVPLRAASDVPQAEKGAS